MKEASHYFLQKVGLLSMCYPIMRTFAQCKIMKVVGG